MLFKILIFLTFSFFTIIKCDPIIESSNNATTSSFYYFAYGSNLLAKRLLLKNPSAVFYSTAKLANYRLDFNVYAPFWNGAVATIVEDEESDVWGTLWKINIDQIKYLDEQEIPEWYYPKNVTVTKPDGTQVPARTYQEFNKPRKMAVGEDLPLDRRPSNTYLAVMALGAIESRLPAEYIGFLFSFPTNGKMAPKDFANQLGYPYVELS